MPNIYKSASWSTALWSLSNNFLLKVLIRKYENSKKYRAWEQEITKNYATKLGPVQVIDRLGNV